jgi:site-specific recombinase XerC
VKTFLRWLGREGYVERELWRGVEMPKVPSYNDVAIDVLSDDEIEQLLALLDPATDVGCRDRGIVCLMLESGLRLEEVVNLKVEDVHLKDSYVKVHGKGDKESYMPLGQTTQKALSRYVEHFRKPVGAREHAFFLNIYGEPHSYTAVQSSFVAWPSDRASVGCTLICCDTRRRRECWQGRLRLRRNPVTNFANPQDAWPSSVSSLCMRVGSGGLYQPRATARLLRPAGK